MTQVEAAKELGVTQARMSDIKRGKINQFSMGPVRSVGCASGPASKVETRGLIACATDVRLL
jgi:predicted XRE-type DNA-binding protein